MGRPQFTLKQVEEICSRFGWTLISEEYVNTRTKLEIECPKGHRSFKSIEKIKEGRGCKKCTGISQRNDFEMVKSKFAELGLTILTDEYKGAHVKLPVVCNNGHHELKTFNSVQKGHKCRECVNDERAAEGNQNYKSDLPESVRLKRRSIAGYSRWRRKVKERDGYTCKCCGVKNVTIDTHHIFGYTKYPQLRSDIDNGITLCETCHKEFHNIYGLNTNLDQMIDFFIAKNRYFGELNDGNFTFNESR